MVRVLSNQLLSKGIRVNAVCPGRTSILFRFAPPRPDSMRFKSHTSYRPSYARSLKWHS